MIFAAAKPSLKRRLALTLLLPLCAILMALDCPEPRRRGLLGFAFERESSGTDGGGAQWLRSQKVFKSIEPDPKNAHDPGNPAKPKRFYTNTFPIQSFLWSDYGAQPGTAYRFRILPMYGKPGALTTPCERFIASSRE